MKVCNKCQIQKELCDFYRKSTYTCKVCFKEQVKLTYLKNKNKRLEQMKAYYIKNKDKIISESNKYYEDNKERILKNKQKHFQQNKSQIINRMNEYKKQRRKSDINFKLRDNLRSRLNHAIKNSQKNGSAVQDLGCTIEELRLHLESKFLPGMTWDNYGNSENCWNIDHIKPLSSFDLSNQEQLKEACNYINLQPMWAKDNIKKSGRL